MVIPGQIISEEHRQGASNVIPDAVLQILVTLEGCEVPFTWELRKNVDDFSLMVKLPAKLRHRRRHVGQRGETRNSAPASPAKSATAKPGHSTLDKLNPVHKATDNSKATQFKKKSPSTLRRDRERRKQWRKRDPRARGNVTNIVAPSNCTSLVTVDTNPITTNVRPSSSEKILDITQPHSTISKSKQDQELPLPSEPIFSPSHNIQRDCEETENSVCEETDNSECGDPWYVDTLNLSEGDACVNCGEEDFTDDIIICHLCDITIYCSKTCHSQHWRSVHLYECDMLAMGTGVKPGSG